MPQGVARWERMSVRHKIVGIKEHKRPVGRTCNKSLGERSCRKRVRWSGTIVLANGIRFQTYRCDEHADELGLRDRKREG